MFGPDEMSVAEWLAMTRWEVEMSAHRGDAAGAATRDAYRGPIPAGGRLTACDQLAWSLIEEAARELQRQQLLKVSFAA